MAENRVRIIIEAPPEQAVQGVSQVGAALDGLGAKGQQAGETAGAGLTRVTTTATELGTQGSASVGLVGGALAQLGSQSQSAGTALVSVMTMATELGTQGSASVGLIGGALAQLGAKGQQARETTGEALSTVTTKAVELGKQGQAAVNQVGIALDNLGTKGRQAGEATAGVTAKTVELGKQGKSAVNSIEASYAQLGLRSSATIRSDIAQTIAAYRNLKNSGIQSAADIEAAYKSMQPRVTSLKQELNRTNFNTAKNEVVSLGLAAGETSLSLASIQSAAGTLGIGFGFREAYQDIKNALMLIDEYKRSTIGIAATLTDTAQGTSAELKRIYQDNLIYAKDTYAKVEMAAAKYFASGKEMVEAWQILTNKGIMLTSDNDIDNLGIVVDKIKMVTEGQSSSIQIAQELRGALSGQARAGDQLAMLLEDRLGPKWKQILDDQVKGGNAIAFIASQIKGVGVASEDIQNTIESGISTQKTIVNQIIRSGLGDMYRDIVNTLKTINGILEKQKTTISGIVAAYYDYIKVLGAATAGLALSGLNPVGAVVAAYNKYQDLQKDKKEQQQGSNEIRQPVRNYTIGANLKFSDVQEQVKNSLKIDESFLKTPMNDKAAEIIGRYAKAFEMMRKAVDSGKLDQTGLTSTGDLWVKTLASQKVELDAVTPKAELRDSLSQQLGSFLYDYATSAINKGVQYEFGAKNINSGEIDCSGFVSSSYRSWFQAIGKQAESLGVTSDMTSALTGSSEMIIEQVGKVTSGILKKTVSGIDKSLLKSGMLIGLDTGDKGWDSDRKLGIDHIVEVIQDAEGKIKIAQSSSSGGGVNVKDFEAWSSQMKNATAYIVDPIEKLRGAFTPTLGEMQRFQVESGKVLQQTKDQNDQLVAQLGYESVSAIIAGIKKKYDREQADILEKLQSANGPTGDLQTAYSQSKSNEAIEIRIAQQKSYQETLKQTADLLERVGELSNDQGLIRTGKEAAARRDYDSTARNINANYTSPDAKAQAQMLNDKQLALELAQIRLSTTKSFEEYYDTFVGSLNGRDQAYFKETQNIFSNELNCYIDISSRMVGARRDAYDQILAYATRTGNAELAAFAQVVKEEAILKDLQNAQKYGNPSDAFWATMSINYGGYKSELTRAREDYVALANDIKTLSDGTFEAVGAAFSGVVKGIASGSLDIQSIWSTLLNKMGDLFMDFAMKIMKRWYEDVIANMFSGTGSGGSGLGSILGSLFGLGGSAASSAYTSSAASTSAMASVGVSPWTSAWGMGFAHGGAFTATTGLPLNSILSSPTFFPIADNGYHPYASGGLGVAGEAGEEALMPLKRMSDNNLGVRVDMGQSNSQDAKPTHVNATVPVKVINVWDMSMLGQYIDSPEGEKKIVNIMRRNGS